jgi:RimJ/RimL family protein N-acetyltransferase
MVAHFTGPDDNPGPLARLPEEQRIAWLEAMEPIEPIRFVSRASASHLTEYSLLQTLLMLFTTPRLIVRPFERTDAPAVIPFWGDADTIRFLGRGKAWVHDEPSAVACITRTGAYYDAHPGYGFFAVELRADTSLVGHIALKPLGDDEIEIGWLLDRRYRGRGIAYEAASGMLRHGFETQGLDQIVAVMYPENTASRRVAERLGMVYQGTRPEQGSTVAWYRLARDMFL